MLIKTDTQLSEHGTKKIVVKHFDLFSKNTIKILFITSDYKIRLNFDEYNWEIDGI